MGFLQILYNCDAASPSSCLPADSSISLFHSKPGVRDIKLRNRQLSVTQAGKLAVWTDCFSRILVLSEKMIKALIVMCMLHAEESPHALTYDWCPVSPHPSTPSLCCNYKNFQSIFLTYWTTKATLRPKDTDNQLYKCFFLSVWKDITVQLYCFVCGMKYNTFYFRSTVSHFASHHIAFFFPFIHMYMYVLHEVKDLLLLSLMLTACPQEWHYIPYMQLMILFQYLCLIEIKFCKQPQPIYFKKIAIQYSYYGIIISF